MATSDYSMERSPEFVVENEREDEVPININDADIFQKDISRLTVADVYDIASSIGREFEKLTDAFGGDVFSDVMPKIIKVLEMLESFAAHSENYSTDVVELQASLQKLQVEEKTKSAKHKEDLDIVETAWRQETMQLLKSVETLQEDNKRLTQLLTEKLEAPEGSETNSDQQSKVLSMLGESVEKQKDELREKNRLIEQQNSECEALSSQAKQLAKLNVDLRRKVAIMEQQALSISSQNTDLESTCREKDRQIHELQKILSDNTRVLEPISEEVLSESVACEISEPTLDPLLAGKLVIDLTDPDRPRYTLNELSQVIKERNKYKLECFVAQEELKYYKQREESWEEIDSTELSDFAPQSEVNNNKNNKSEGGIRKFFSFLQRH